MGGVTAFPLISARTYNDMGTLGTYGQYIPSLDFKAGGGSDGQTMYFAGLSSDSDFRMNFGMVNGDPNGAAMATATLRDLAGQVLGTYAQYLGLPLMGLQLQNADLLADMNITQSFENATLEVDIGGQNLFCYVSSVDNITNAPIFMLPNIQ